MPESHDILLKNYQESLETDTASERQEFEKVVKFREEGDWDAAEEAFENCCLLRDGIKLTQEKIAVINSGQTEEGDY